MRSLLRQVEELAQQHQAVEIEDIEVEVGPLSGVEPLLLQSAFERLRESTPCKHARLSIRHTGLDIICLECRAESTLENFRFVCPECRSASVQILRGEEFRLLTVKMQTDDAEAAPAR